MVNNTLNVGKIEEGFVFGSHPGRPKHGNI